MQKIIVETSFTKLITYSPKLNECALNECALAVLASAKTEMIAF